VVGRAGWFAALLWAVMATSTTLAQAPAAEEPLRYVPRRYFTIPFQIESNEQQQVRQLLLYQRSGTAPWEYKGSVTPQQRGFDFRTDRDGEFSFAVRAEYNGGAFMPARVEDLTPSLRVIIDTVAPVVSLRSVRRGGDIGVEWDCRDDYLDPTTLKLEYRTTTGDWRPLEAEPRAIGNYLWPAQPNTRLEMRLTIRDKANNLGEATTLVTGDAAPPSGGNGFADPAPRMAEPAAPARPGIYYLNNKRISLAYKIAKEGLSGVAGVDLWVCDRDMRKWEKVQQPAGATPIDQLPAGGRLSLVYDAHEDDLYGFRMVARSGVGLSDPDPRPGDQPQVWVEVDTTKPTAKIVDVLVNQDGEPRKLLITWSATDKNLTDQPIHLEYAPTPTGPWSDVAHNLPNTGRYVWMAPDREPFKFVIRLRAIDKATNEGEDVSKEVIVDLVRPKAELIDVLPGAGSPAR
jgi:hypothetical protein